MEPYFSNGHFVWILPVYTRFSYYVLQWHTSLSIFHVSVKILETTSLFCLVFFWKKKKHILVGPLNVKYVNKLKCLTFTSQHTSFDLNKYNGKVLMVIYYSSWIICYISFDVLYVLPGLQKCSYMLLKGVFLDWYLPMHHF